MEAVPRWVKAPGYGAEGWLMPKTPWFSEGRLDGAEYGGNLNQQSRIWRKRIIPFRHGAFCGRIRVT
jgi:hypothetical protein